MKKLLFAMMIISSYFMLPSCSKSSDATPTTTDVTATISITANGKTVSDGGYVFLDDSVVVSVNCTGNSSNALTNLKLTSDAPGFTTYTTSLSGTSVSKSAPRWPGQGSGVYTFTAVVTGSAGTPATVTFKIDVAQIVSTNPEIGNQASATPKFYSTSVTNNTGVNTFDLSDVLSQPKYALDTAIDFGYCTRKTASYLIASPDDSNLTAIYGAQWSATAERITNWPKRNKTRFILTTITSGDFDKATTNTQIIAMFTKAKAAGEPNLSSISVFDTQVYLFKTDGGKYGLMEIVGPTGSINTASPFNVLDGTVNMKVHFLN